MLNKKAEAVGNQIMWVWSMFLIVIAGGGIALGVSIFYGPDYDIKMLEAGILSNSISECLSKEAIDFNDETSFYSKCRLSQKVLSEDYALTRINIKICENKCDNGKIIFQLGSDFESCDFKGKNDKYQRCVKRFFNDIKGERLEIIVGSNHLLRRVN